MKRYKIPDYILARNIKRFIAESNMSQGQFAKVLDVDRKAVCNWVNGYTSPTALDLKNICQAYNLSADELLGLKGGKYGKNRD